MSSEQSSTVLLAQLRREVARLAWVQLRHGLVVVGLQEMVVAPDAAGQPPAVRGGMAVPHRVQAPVALTAAGAPQTGHDSGKAIGSLPGCAERWNSHSSCRGSRAIRARPRGGAPGRRTAESYQAPVDA